MLNSFVTLLHHSNILTYIKNETQIALNHKSALIYSRKITDLHKNSFNFFRNDLQHIEQVEMCLKHSVPGVDNLYKDEKHSLTKHTACPPYQSCSG